MSDKADLNERGNHPGEFTQGVGGWAEYTVEMTEIEDRVRHDVRVPSGKVIPIIFLPGVMGSNLRMSKKTQGELDRTDNRSWRPDDLMGLGGKQDVITGTDLGGWLKNATPAQRQMNFNPNETEVEYYHYTENQGRFDPDGKETKAADIRHQNVPNSLGAIPPLLGPRASTRVSLGKECERARRRGSPAQQARWRGWSEILFAGAYGDILRNAEMYLNNMVAKGHVHSMWKPLLKDPLILGATSGPPLTESDIKRVADCWYPVHALGYNFLRSNGDSAKMVADRIRGLVKGYQRRGFKCDEVIVVTHSMGGLLGRALLHPHYGAMANDNSVKILGMYHSVMPSMGAAATYKRMRFGFQENDGIAAEYMAKILGFNGEHATAILANAPGPLELLPGAWYGTGWLKIIDRKGSTLCSWPEEGGTALESIYLQPQNVWWRLINPLWIDPANLYETNDIGARNVFYRLKNVAAFIKSIEAVFHPTQSYASYCSSVARPCYGEVVFRIQDSELPDTLRDRIHDQKSWILHSDDGKGTLKIRAGHRIITLKLEPGRERGDETVPAERSARSVPGMKFVHGEHNSQSYEHQNSFANSAVRESMLYSIVQIAKTAKWNR